MIEPVVLKSQLKILLEGVEIKKVHILQDGRILVLIVRNEGHNTSPHPKYVKPELVTVAQPQEVVVPAPLTSVCKCA
ncbi:hypothetical protein V6N13_041488 [Hibiscus sabdariffa]